MGNKKNIMKKIQTALISISDKTDLKPLLKVLSKYNIKIISSGGTFKTIQKLKFKCSEVSYFTGTKEILEELFPEGLVKLGDIKALKDKVITVSNKDHPFPKENTFTSDRMINETINLYHQLLSKEV